MDQVIHFPEIRRLQVLGLLGIASVGTLQAQVGFRPAVPQDFGIEQYPEPADTFISQYQFLDIDGDGDLDGLFLREDGRDYYSPTSCNFQLNEISGENGVYTESAPVSSAGACYAIYPGANFQMADLDDDGDLDIYQYNYYVYGYWGGRAFIRVYENISGSVLDTDFPGADPVIAIFDVPDYIGGSISWAISTEFSFADLDGDGLKDLILNYDVSLDYGYDRKIDTYVYINNGSGGVMPFTEGPDLYNPYGLDVIFDIILENNWNIHRFFWRDIDADGDIDLGMATLPVDPPEDVFDFDVHFALNQGNDETGFAPGIHLARSIDGFIGLYNSIYYLRHMLFMEDIDSDGDADILYNSVIPDDYYYYVATNTLFFSENTAVQTTALNEIEKLPFSIYPNPAASVATLRLASADIQGPYIVEVMDVAGRVVCQFQSEDQSIYFKQRDIGTGLFLVRLTTPDGKAAGSKKLIFTH